MGLDMYLMARKFMQWDKTKDRTKKIEKLFPEIGDSQLDYVIFEIGYWRKANHIHKWFVENVQKGEDDCETYSISLEQLKELLDIVNKILNEVNLIKGEITTSYTFNDEGKKIPIKEEGKIIDKPKICAELLPTTEGFFFGGTDYDEYYHRDLVNTKKILEKSIKLVELGWDIEYHSSW